MVLPAVMPALLPALLALISVFPPLRAAALGLAPFAALPALLAALGVAELVGTYWPWALLGTWLDLGDALSSAGLLFTSGLWLSAGLFARAEIGFEGPRSHGFWRYWLLTSTGNLGVFLAQDTASFYLFFALLTFAAYGLILHARSADAERAGRVYITMAIFGETALLAALFVLVSEHGNLRLARVPEIVADSPHRGLLSVLFLVGFGVKAGLVPLHLWLPLAHPIAPTAASAVLSGALIKAGVLGWLRFLPLDRSPLPALGELCMALGILAAAAAALIGVTQRNPKTALAYSSVSQMGIMTLALGGALSTGEAGPGWKLAIIAYLSHHALAKGALFLGAGTLHHARRSGAFWLVLIGLVWSGLEIAGAPLTSGAYAKLSLKHALSESLAHAPEPLLSKAQLSTTLSLLAVFSTLLMARVCFLVTRPAWLGTKPVRPGLLVPWVSLLILDTLLFLDVGSGLAALVSVENLFSALWPVLLGASSAGLAFAVARRLGLQLPELPAGDLLTPLTAGLRLARDHSTRLREELLGPMRSLKLGARAGLGARVRYALDGLMRLERGLANLWVVGVVMLLWVASLLYVLHIGR